MKQYTFNDFSIVSTQYDNLLFFDNEYQVAVNEAINKIAEKVGELPDSLQVVCKRTMIELRDRRVKPSFYVWELLNYNENECKKYIKTDDNNMYQVLDYKSGNRVEIPLNKDGSVKWFDDSKLIKKVEV